MTTELDRFPVSQLGDRYNIARSNIYERLSALGIKPEKVQGRSFLNADQLSLMDALHAHIGAGGNMADFGKSDSMSDLAGQDGTGRSLVLPATGQAEMSYGTDRTAEWSGVVQAAEAIAFRLLEAALGRLPIANPLANLERIEQAYEKGWLLSTSQLAPLLGVKGLSGKTVDRFGFRFVRCGKNGAESAWRIEKAPVDAIQGQPEKE